MVHQHFMLVPVFSVVENVILGVEPTTGADYLDLDAAGRRSRPSTRLRNAGADRRADRDASVGIQQRVEILKVLFRSADVLILDEPTAVLTPQEVEEFFTIVRSLRDAGKASSSSPTSFMKFWKSPTASACFARAGLSAAGGRTAFPRPTLPR